jgi:hypothetical protein
MGGPNQPHANEDDKATAVADPDEFFGEDKQGDDDTPPIDDNSGDDQPQAAEPEPAPEPARQGTTERDYLVHEELVLDQEMLAQLAKGLKDGDEPLTVLLEVERVEARTVADAIRVVWKKHGKRYGQDGVALVVAAANRLQRKTVKPVPPKITKDSLEIT